MLNLSYYFPKGTEYFYGYPAQENSNFYNTVPTEIEELVSERPLLCAGPDVKAVCFPSFRDSFTLKFMREELQIPFIADEQILILPDNITANLRGEERNKAVMKALKEIVTPGNFIMAQPYTDPELEAYYQISCETLLWLNDKKNMHQYIPSELLPERYAEFQDGPSFKASTQQYPLSCVVKVSSSSSGDGVRMCHTLEDLENAKRDFENINGTIIIQQYIIAKRNIGVQFGIPSNPELPIELIGWHEQLTDDKGVFLGGLLDTSRESILTEKMKTMILEEILPFVRRKGWYGIGGFDVLITAEGRPYFIDPNFRMTGTTNYHCLVRNKILSKPFISFMGIFEGTEKDFREAILPLASPTAAQRLLYLTALTKYGRTFRFNAAMLYDEELNIGVNADVVLKQGVKAGILERFAFRKQ